MRKRRRVPRLLLAVVLVLALFRPAPASAATLYFTAINNSVAPLTSETMPFWSGGTLYVPYTIFDASLNGIGVSLGLYTSYNRDSRTVTLFNLRQMLTFDLNSGMCRDDVTGTTYISRAIMRGGRPYLALGTVCSHFDLEYSYNQLPNIPQGFLVRIKNRDTVMSDADFVSAARNVISNRLREYTQSLNPAESTDPGVDPSVPTNPAVPGGPAVVGKDDTAAYLAFRCETAAGLTDILDTLRGSGRCAVFFLTPRLLEEGDLVRRILGGGHSVGILADGGEAVPLLEQGGLALERAACARTTLTYADAGRQEELEARGWVCWKETVLLRPDGTVNANTFASGAVRRLGKRDKAVCLTLEGGEDAARVLPALLRYLDRENYIVSIPLETVL